MSHISLLMLLCAVASVYSQVPNLGKCPVVPAQSTMDLQKYLGIWYEIATFPNSFERGKCTRAKYTVKPNGHVEVFNRAIEDGKVFNATADAFVPNATEPAKFLVQFAAGAPYANYWVIDTDYTHYSLVYSCEAIIGVAHLEFAWILSRNMTLDDATTQKLMKELASHKVDVSKFKKTDQTDCPP